MPTRRELLFGAAGAAGALALAAAAARATRDAFRTATDRPRGADPMAHGPYGHGVEPPGTLGPAALDAATIPPPPTRGPVTRELTITQRPVPVAQGATLDAWTFEGTIPGPTLRVTEGETLTLRVRNLTGHPHNLHTHGAHAPESDGWEPIPPAGERTYVLRPRPAGIYPYHCDLTPGAQHLGRGLYGLLIVDPVTWRPPAQERVLLLGGFDTDGDGVSDAFGWNGVAGFHARHPIKLARATPVRLYVANFVVDEPVATFHLHARTFDVFRSGTRPTPDDTLRADCERLMRRLVRERCASEPELRALAEFLDHIITRAEKK